MIKTINGIKLGKLNIHLLFTLLMMSTLNISQGGIRLLGRISILLLLIASFFQSVISLTKWKTIPKYLSSVIISSFILNIVYLIGLINDGFSTRGIEIYLQLTLLLVFFIGIVQVQWNNTYTKIFSRGIAVYVIANVILFLSAGLPYPFKGFTSNSNGLASIIYLMTFFIILRIQTCSSKLSKKINYVILIFCIILLVISQSRAALISFLISTLVFWKWEIISKSKKRYYFLFIGIVLLITIFTLVLPILISHPNAIIWNQFVRKYTGANLFSGRERIWGILIETIKSKPFIGYGAGTSLTDIASINLSAHNLYLQTALQVGLLGLLALIILLLNIYKLFYRSKQSLMTRLAAAYFIGILLHQSFEVSLTQNNLAIGLNMWLIFAIGIGNFSDEKSMLDKQANQGVKLV